MSAARAAARNKPVILVKAGRAPECAKAAASHTGALAGSDAVFDAAVRRAGMLRVHSLEALFDAAQTLARGIRPGAGYPMARGEKDCHAIMSGLPAHPGTPSASSHSPDKSNIES